ncbi:MAG: cobalt transporter [Leptolyngbya sp. SIO1D8]|nr:cobalt transporter [Leptolyngbya sp. SIO1D8]
MKRLPLLSSVLALSLALSTPAALAHVGHGDEFQAEGGVDRVEINAETDSLLGIQVSSIEENADGSGAVMIPVSALVEDGDRQLVFVLYENFYEPVPVTTGATQGEMIEILEGVSAGEPLVTQGSLSLYAESRKSQTAEAEPEAAETTTSTAPTEEAPVTEATEAETTEVEASDVAEAPVETAEASSGFPIGLVAAIGAGAALLVGAIVFLSGGKKGNV